MDHKRPVILASRFRPGAFAPMGEIFIKAESPCGSIFLPVGDDL
jgi:hypothetical protein